MTWFKKKLFLVALLSVVADLSFAATEDFTVTATGIDVASKVVFVGVTPSSVSSSCNARNEFKWNLADSGAREIFSLALAAQAAGKKIQIGVADGAVCVNGQPTGWWVKVIN
jgi:hypothetical protein